MFDPTRKAAELGKEFREFVMKTNMLALALGVVIGAAVGGVVNAIVKELVMPVVGVITPSGQWRNLRIQFWRFDFGIGPVLGELLNFVIIAAVVFMITKGFVKATKPPPTKPCPRCKEGIHPDATRCKYCTSDVPLEAPAPEAPKP